MKKLVLLIAAIAFSVSACGGTSDSGSYHAVCTDPNTQQVVDPSYCNGGGSGGNAVWDYILLSTFLNQIHSNPHYYDTGVHITNVHYHLPANSSAKVGFAGKTGTSTVKTSKSGTIKSTTLTSTKNSNLTRTKTPTKTKSKIPSYGTPPKPRAKTGKCC